MPFCLYEYCRSVVSVGRSHVIIDIFVLFCLLLIALILRRNASPGTRSVYNSTISVGFEEKYTQLLSKLISFCLSFGWHARRFKKNEIMVT